MFPCRVLDVGKSRGYAADSSNTAVGSGTRPVTRGQCTPAPATIATTAACTVIDHVRARAARRRARVIAVYP